MRDLTANTVLYCKVPHLQRVRVLCGMTKVGDSPIAQTLTFVYTPNMTPELLERDWLSLRYWLQKCVLPSALVLLLVLGLFRLIGYEVSYLNHSAVIVGFFALYFVLIRGGHIIMIRSLHFELKRKYEDAYREKLAYVPKGQIKRRNIGFTLARIKRELIDTHQGNSLNKR